MDVRQGWSGEQSDGSWRKIDIACDESDLQRICQAQGINRNGLTVTDVYSVLASEANTLLFFAVHVATGRSDYADKARASQKQHDDTVSNIRRRQSSDSSEPVGVS